MAKRVLSILLVAIMTFCLFAVFSGCKKEGENGSLYIYNWSEYIPPEIYDLFEEETGIKVHESLYDSNEEMLSRLQASGTGQFDILVPSTYIVSVLVEEGFIQPINKDNIENMKNLDPNIVTEGYNEYVVPYMGTFTIIAYNEDMVADLGIDGFTTLNDLLDPRLEGNLVVLDDARELIDAALKANGLEPDCTDEETIESIVPWLKDLAKNVVAYDSQSPKTLLATNQVAVGLVYNIDAGQAIQENDRIRVAYVAEPGEMNIDNFAITSTAKNVENAELFISFIHRPDIYKMILDEFPGVCVNDAALAILDDFYLENAGSNIDKSEIARAHYPKDVGEAAAYYDSAFEEMKS